MPSASATGPPDPCFVFGVGRGQGMEDQGAGEVPNNVHAIQGENVQVNIQSQRGVCPLDGDHGAWERFAHAGETEVLFGAPSQRAHQLARECAGSAAAQLGVVAEQGAHAPGEAADPVTDGHLGQDRALEMHGAVTHATGKVRWTKTAAFTAESDQLGVATLATLELQEAKIQDAESGMS